MTDRFALSYVAELNSMARIKDNRSRRSRPPRTWSSVVSERTQLRKAGARYLGRCPFHEERH